jgi:hypothetical protein
MKTPSNFGRTCEAQAYDNIHEQNQSLDLVPKMKPPPEPERKRPKPQFQGQCDIEDSSDRFTAQQDYTHGELFFGQGGWINPFDDRRNQFRDDESELEKADEEDPFLPKCCGKGLAEVGTNV